MLDASGVRRAIGHEQLRQVLVVAIPEDQLALMGNAFPRDPRRPMHDEARGWFEMTVVVPTGQGSVALPLLDTEGPIERWRKGHSPQTLRTYSNDLKHIADWLGKFLGGPPLRAAEAVTALLGKPQGEARLGLRDKLVSKRYRARSGAAGHDPETDRDPQSSSYGSIVDQPTIPNKDDELYTISTGTPARPGLFTR
jgi:hypothetical protein